jgi:hypothetical protein
VQKVDVDMPEEQPGSELPAGYGAAGYVPFRYDSFAPQFPAVPSPPKRRRRGRWVIAAIVLLLLLASIATFFIARYITRSTPDKTMDAFCSALQQGDYQSAYAQFSPKLQHIITESAFAAIFSQDKVNLCTHGTAGEAGTSVTSTIRLLHVSQGVNNDVVTLTKDSSDTWKIDDIYRQ